MSLFTLLQIDTGKVADSVKSATTGTGATPSMNIFDMLISGGPLMIPIALCLVIAIWFFFERLIAINKAAKIDENFMRIIRDNIVSGNVTAARNLARNTSNPVARV